VRKLLGNAQGERFAFERAEPRADPRSGNRSGGKIEGRTVGGLVRQWNALGRSPVCHWCVTGKTYLGLHTANLSLALLLYLPYSSPSLGSFPQGSGPDDSFLCFCTGDITHQIQGYPSQGPSGALDKEQRR
jgi:hypothetical protein